MKPTKTRKLLFTAPNHVRSSNVRSRLSTELRTKYSFRATRIRKGDAAKIERGEFVGVEGKVTGVDIEKGTVTIEGVTREKIAGGTVNVKIHSSNLLVTALNLDDKLRKRKLEERSS